MMTTIDILKKARELLSDEKRWTKGVYARNNKSFPCSPTSAEAICWCPMGAIAHVENLKCSTLDIRLSAQGSAASFILDREHTPTWNDAPERIHAEVLQRFDDAIARLETGTRKTIWLCGACGRTGATRMTVGDESCYLHSVEVYEDSIQRNLNGRIKAAQAVVSVDNIERKETAS